MEVGVRGAVHEVDGVGNAVPHGELDRVHVVAEGVAEGEGVPRDTQGHVVRDSLPRDRRVARFVGLLRGVRNDPHLPPARDPAPVVVGELDRLLGHHRQGVGSVVRVEELLAAVDLVDVLPAAAVGRLHEDGEAEVAEDLVPVDESHVPERLLGRVRRVLLVREEDRPGHGDTDGPGHDVVEELVVGRPPERVVDDLDAPRGRALEERPVERHLVADAVEDHVVRERLLLGDVPDLDGFPFHGEAATPGQLVDLVAEGPRKRVLHAEQDPDRLHAHGYLHEPGFFRTRDRNGALFEPQSPEAR